GLLRDGFLGWFRTSLNLQLPQPALALLGTGFLASFRFDQFLFNSEKRFGLPLGRTSLRSRTFVPCRKSRGSWRRASNRHGTDQGVHRERCPADRRAPPAGVDAGGRARAGDL